MSGCRKESGVDNRLNLSQQTALADKRVSSILECGKHSISKWSEEVILPPQLELLWPPLNAVCSSGLHNIKRMLKYLNASRERQ